MERRAVHRDRAAPARPHAQGATPSRNPVLDLQRSAGNAAVSYALRARVPVLPPRKSVQRWEAEEHEMLGDKGSGHRTVELAPGYRLNFGEITALGDHFAGIEQMREFAANTKGGAGSRAEIEYARTWKLGKQGLTFDATAKAAQEARYYTLAGGNRAHFLNAETADATKGPAARAGDPLQYLGAKYTKAPGNAGQGYRIDHVRAIAEAVEAAHRKGSTDQAMAREAFASHFLTDAFSAGHVRAPRASAKAHWDAKVPMFVYNLTGFIAEVMAQNLPVFQKKVVPTDTTLRHDLPKYGVLAQVQDLLATKKFTFGDLVGGALHDWDNSNGVATTVNGHDAFLRGDGQLVVSDNQAMPVAIKAVGEGVSDIEQAFALGHQGMSVEDVLDALLHDGLFAPETWLPVAKPDAAQTADRKAITWEFPSVYSLMADERFKGAVLLFLNEKAGELESVGRTLEPAQFAAFKKGVVDPLKADPIGTLMAVVQWVPGLTRSNEIQSEGAAEYVRAAEKVKGGTASLTLHQRVRLVSKLMRHSFGGKRELMSVLTTGSDSDARQLINLFRWDRLHAKIDERSMPFKDRFPEDRYAKR